LARRRSSDIGVVLAAGGRGRRFGRAVPKQFLKLRGKPILQHSLERFAGLAAVREIVVVVPEEHARRAAAIIRRSGVRRRCQVVAGGAERQESVGRGLRALDPACRIVLVHDAARPLVSAAVVERVIRATRRFGAAMAALRVSDTIKREGQRGFATETVRREQLWAAQTPQGFRRSLLERAHRQAVQEGVVGTDEASLLERMGKKVRLVEGSPKNLKITTREDFLLAAGFAGRPGRG